MEVEEEVLPKKEINDDPQKQRFPKLIIVITVSVLSIVGISIVFGSLVQQDKKAANLRTARSVICDKENPTVVDVNICSDLYCTFDTTTCEVPCPFDYIADEAGCTTGCECAVHGLYQGNIRFDSSEIMDLAERYGHIDPEKDFEIFYGSLENSTKLWTDYLVDNRYKIPYELSLKIATGGVLGVWGEWGTCDNHCDQVRKRRCRDDQNRPVPACDQFPQTYEFKKRSCDPEHCASLLGGEWGHWSSCSASSDGTKKRVKTCRGTDCLGTKEETVSCDVGARRFVRSASDANFFEKSEVVVAGQLCSEGSGAKWIFGDFNGDGGTDIMCYDRSKEYSVGNIDKRGNVNKISSRGRMTGCGDGRTYVGDFNGDGKDDILCRDEVTRELVVKFMASNGVFNGVDADGGSFCTGPTDVLFAMNVNNDKTMDLLCHFGDKHIEVRMNER